MANLKKMDQALTQAPSIKAAIQLSFVKELVTKNYQSITGRKDGDNYFASQVFELLSIMNEKPELQSCDRFSMMGAMVKTASWGYSFQDGFVDLMKIGNILRASLNYKGHRDQLRQMPNIESVGEGVLVLKGEEFSWDKANNRVVKHIANEEDSLLNLDNIRYSYVRVTFKDKSFADIVVSNEELRKAKSKSKLKGEGSVWETWCGEMCKKVAVHRAYKTYYRKPQVSPELNLGDFGKDDDDDTFDIGHKEEAPQPEKPVETARVVGTSDSMDDFLKDKR